MPKATHISKGLATAFVVLTVSAITGLITMIVIYKMKRADIDPTPPPTFVPPTEPPPPVLRLPRYLIPRSYDVFLQPHLYSQIIEEVNVTSPNQTMVFTGNSTVNFYCAQRTKSIYLHSVDLTISDAVVRSKDKNHEIGVSSINQEDEGDFLVVKLEEALEEDGNYSLSLGFKGEIADNLEGLYVSIYTEGLPEYEGDPNAERYLAATNNEPTYTRRIFPCFDEPDMKAVFHVTIIHRQSTTALGNAGMESTVIRDGWKYTKFDSTDPMSTYLFAFVVSEFTSVESSHERVTIKTYARPEAIKAGHADYAASITGKILSFYEELFGIQYSQKKLDQIALPDLGPAAMENWGLITYQEGVLLYEEGVSSLMHKEMVAMLIAHELAHQWFGNLVTMKWWNEIWLNEGFATYLSYLAVDHVEPSFGVKDRFIMNDLQGAFEEDALASSHPLTLPENKAQTNNEIMGMFDSITYSKGATVLRMLSDAVDEKVFNQGIRTYLQAHSYGNVDQNNLWEHIQKAVDDDKGQMKDVAKVMSTWTNQTGYPVITINTTSGTVTQKQFLFNDTVQSSLLWDIPMRVMSNTTTFSLFFFRESGPVSLDQFLSKEGEWILANVNCTGYYRVNYNPENWDALVTQLLTNPHRIPVMNRAQLIDDAFNLARAKLVDVTLALNLTRFLRNERSHIPWESAQGNLWYFILMFDRTEVNGPMQAYLQQQVKGLYNFLSNYTDNSIIPEDHSLQISQSMAIRLACSSGLPACVNMAKEMFAQWMDSNSTNKIHPNLRSVIYCHALAHGGKTEWEFAWEKYLSSSDTSEREHLRAALACTKKIWLLNRLLEYTLDPEKIRLMDVASTIMDISTNVAGQALAWNFIRAHWEYVSQGDAAMLIQGVTSRFSTQFELEELERFGNDYTLGAATREVEQAIEQTKVNIEWVGENKKVIMEWFEGESSL